MPSFAFVIPRRPRKPYIMDIPLERGPALLLQYLINAPIITDVHASQPRQVSNVIDARTAQCMSFLTGYGPMSL